MNISIPERVYKDDRACGEFLFEINRRISKLEEIQKQLRDLKTEVSKHMLDRLSATGQKNFHFENLGMFSRKVSTKVSFPSAERGGHEAAVDWLTMCMERQLISPTQLLSLQQSRLVADAVLNLEQTVADYNMQQKLKGSTDLIPESPFNHYEQVTLSVPRTRKA